MNASKITLTRALLLLAAVVLSCANPEATRTTQKTESTPFEQFVKDVPLVALPFELSTSEEFKHLAIESKFIPEGAALIGKLPSKNGMHFLLYSYPADIRLPILEIYTNDGAKINEISLFKSACPITNYGHSKITMNSYDLIFQETICDAYDSRIDYDTLVVNGLIRD